MEQFHSVKIVMSIYKKLLVSCNEQMYVFCFYYFNIILLKNGFVFPNELCLLQVVVC